MYFFPPKIYSVNILHDPNPFDFWVSKVNLDREGYYNIWIYLIPEFVSSESKGFEPDSKNVSQSVQSDFVQSVRRTREACYRFSSALSPVSTPTFLPFPGPASTCLNKHPRPGARSATSTTCSWMRMLGNKPWSLYQPPAPPLPSPHPTRALILVVNFEKGPSSGQFIQHSVGTGYRWKADLVPRGVCTLVFWER